ncbi:tyrosine-type recombinase/integrase [Vibrio nigripulchritudo]|nr:tyrosine-type recombinase/integrase [Vibrio nigripulchritudo]
MAALKPDARIEQLQTVATANMQHTMTRPSEAAGARWDEIDIENRLWIIPDTRMNMKREYRIPLTDQTITILKRIHPNSEHRVHLFPYMCFPKQFIDSETINKTRGVLDSKIALLRMVCALSKILH